jgi:hypothetical protein
MKPAATLADNLAILRNVLAGGFLNLAGLGFAVYIFVIFYPGIRATPGMLMSLRAGETTMADVGEGSLYIAVPCLLLGLLLFARHGFLVVIGRFATAIVLLCVFSSLVLLLTILVCDYPDSITQMTQYVVTLGGFLLCLCFWQAPERDVDNALAMAVLALSASLITAAAVQGFHDYRWVGLIHPNHYARYAYIALVLHAILTRRVDLPIFVLCFAAAYMVSARTLMIAMVLFYAGYLCCIASGIPADRNRRAVGLRALAGALIGLPVVTAGVLMSIDSDRLIERLTNDLAIFDPDRGVFSGFTGRSDSWNAFFDAMDDFAFFGYGFRSSRYNLHTVHSGVLSYFLDFGLILGGALLFAVVARALYLIWFGRKYNDRRGMICGLAIASTLVIQSFEPDNFNIGFIGAFFFMLILAYARQPAPGSSERHLVWRRTATLEPVVAPGFGSDSPEAHDSRRGQSPPPFNARLAPAS